MIMERLDGLQELVLKSFEGTESGGMRADVRTAPNYSPEVNNAMKQLLKEQYIEQDSLIGTKDPSPRQFYDFYKITTKGKDYLKAIKPITIDIVCSSDFEKLNTLTKDESEHQVIMKR
jgi:hypothetical protein